ncbi:MinD-like ATPase involved in chromosome partitioning or flagellar assembly, partial [Naumannella cuiyingiana]
VDHHAITVSALKGGITKTTVVLAIGTVLALHRRDLVLAIDANAHRGTLAQRLGEETTKTVRDLAGQLNQVTSATDFRRFTSQADTRLEVLASERDPVKAQGFSAEEYRDVVDVAKIFRSVILTDTGTDLTLPLMAEVYRATDTLVVTATTAHDGIQLAAETLDWWAEFAGEELVSHAVLAVTEIVPFTLRPDQTHHVEQLLQAHQQQQQQRRAEIRAQLGGRVAEIIFVPYDPHLHDGGHFAWHQLGRDTQIAYEQLAYAIAQQFGGRGRIVGTENSRQSHGSGTGT